ncbi:hypothetical protein [Streptomyces sp. SAI-25]|uniref:hypothetical protein n=1 Tax=Streptomyces sp. SAI-25 TaxID=1472664 RepID=UPI00403A265B
MGSQPMVDQVDRLTAEYEALGIADPIEKVIEHFASKVVRAARPLCPPGRDLDKLLFTALNDDEATAHFEPYEDGSGLVVVTDALASLCSYLAQLWTWSLEPAQNRRWGTRLSLISMLKPGPPDPEQIRRQAVLLRYHHVHQRVWGLPAKLGVDLRKKNFEIASAIAESAMCFVLAHEVSHFILGHKAQSHGFGPMEGSGFARREESAFYPVVDPKTETEREADSMAFTIMERLAQQQAQGKNAAAQQGQSGVASLGMMLSMLALHTLESSLLLRTSHAHPPAGTRLAALRSKFPVSVQNASAHVLQGVAQSVDIASNLSRSLPIEWWEQTFAHPRVQLEPHSMEYLRMVAQIDDICAHSAENCLRFLSVMHSQGLPDLGEGFRLVDHGNILGALKVWGVSEIDQQVILTKELPVSFHSLQDAVYRSKILSGIPSANKTTRLILATAAARVLELGPHLRRSPHEHA